MRRILSRCGLILVILAGLAGGVAGRLMWQPRVVAVSVGPQQAISSDREVAAQPKPLSGAVPAPPLGIDSDAWKLLLERPPAGAWAATLERLERERHPDLRELVMLAWCELDGAAALSWLADQPLEHWPLSFGQWMKKHPAIAWKAALAKDNLQLASLIVRPAALAADPAAVREILSSSNGRFRNVVAEMGHRFVSQDYETGFLRLAAADADAAARVLRLAGPSYAPDPLLKAWLKADPTAPEKLLAGCSPRVRAMWQVKLVAHFALDDRRAAEAILAAMPDGSDRDTAAKYIARAHGELDPQSEPAPASSSTAIAKLIAAEPMVLDFPGVIPKSPEAVAQTLSKLDPAMATPETYAEIASSWARGNPERASQWVADLAAGPARDAAIGGLVNALIAEPQTLIVFRLSSRQTLNIQSPAEMIDYASALTWAAAAGQSATREELALKIARRWLDVDPDAAVEGLRSVNLPDDQKLRLSVELGMQR